MRTTSIDAYNAVVKSGFVNRSRLKVYDTLFHHGPLTQSETEAEIALTTGSQRTTSYHKRFSELERLGLIKSVGVRQCRVTHREVMTWDVTPNAPSQPVPQVSWKNRYTAAKRELDDLKRKLEKLDGQIDLFPGARKMDEVASTIERLFLHEHKPLNIAVREALKG